MSPRKGLRGLDMAGRKGRSRQKAKRELLLKSAALTCLAAGSEPVIRHLGETCAKAFASADRHFTRSDFNPTSLARSPELRYLRTVIVTKEPFSTALDSCVLVESLGNVWMQEGIRVMGTRRRVGEHIQYSK